MADATALFVKAYDDRMSVAFQQGKRKLAGMVDDGGVFIGDELYFPKMEAIEAMDMTRLQDLLLNTPDHSMMKVSCSPKYAALPIADVDKNKLNVKLATWYADQTVKAIYRSQDKTIYTAMLAAANAGGSTITTLGSYNNPISLELIAEAVGILGEREAFEDASVGMILPFRGKMNLSTDLNTALAVSDNREIVKGLGRFLDPLSEIQAETYEGTSNVTPAQDNTITAGKIGTDLFIFNKMAVVSAYNDDVVAINERLGTKLADMKGAWTQVGAAVRRGEGIIRIKAQRNAAITLKALKMSST